VTPPRLPPQLGSVVWAEVKDANGFRKARPAVVVATPTDATSSEPLRIAAITTRLSNPLPDDRARLCAVPRSCANITALRVSARPLSLGVRPQSVRSVMWITLRDLRFPIGRAELSAAVPDPYWSAKYNPSGDRRLFWYFELQGERAAGVEMWEPLVYHQNLHFPVRRWVEVAGQAVEWSTAVDDESGEPNGSFYVLEHEAISRGRLRFLERDGLRFRFSWDGVCDVFWDEEFGRDVPFSAEGWAMFTEVIVRGSENDTAESLRERLEGYLETRDFVQGLLCRDGPYNDGVGAVHAVFTPVG